eukprot:SAG11_NODE_4833_length_1750_cov_10.776499_1_plen_63_part_01
MCTHDATAAARHDKNWSKRVGEKPPSDEKWTHTHTLGNWLSRTRGELHPGPDSTVLCASSGDP